MVVDLTPFGEGMGTQVAYAMDVAGMYANHNSIPTDMFTASSPALGHTAVTSRGMKEPQWSK
jgi:glycine/serine hydroxymethyltransferase